MRTYGRLRDQHSVEMAQKVRFSKLLPENVVQMPKQTSVAPQNVRNMDVTGHKTAPPAAPSSQSPS
jgi:hypothetical protein